MKKDLILIVPDKYNDYYSILHSKKNITNKHNFKSTTLKEINPPFSTEYETINLINKSATKRIAIKKILPENKSPLPIISKHGLLYSTNRLLTLNKKSLEGFKPIEDNKIRNKFKLKNINNPLSIKYLSLNENKEEEFDKYVTSLLKKDKNKNFSISNLRYSTNINNEEFFNKKGNLKHKINILNKFLNKTYEKHKKQFKKYYIGNKDYLKELLTIEILNKTSRIKYINNNKKTNNNNRLITHFSPNTKKISLKSAYINTNNNISYETLKNLKNTNFNKCSACYRKQIINNEEKGIQIGTIREKEKEKELIIHNVFFEWVLDNVIMKIDNNKFLNYYNNLFNQNRLLSAQKNIKYILNKEIRILSNYLFKNNPDLNHSFDSLINSIRPISNDIIKIRKKPKKISEKNKKKLKSADLAKTNYYKYNYNFDNSISSNENSNEDIDLKQKILNKLIDKITNSNRIDNLDIKNISQKKKRKYNVLISGKKNLLNENDLSISLNNNSISNINDNSKDMSITSKTPKVIKIENNLNKYKLPGIKKKNYMKMFISKYYPKNYQRFFKLVNKMNGNDKKTIDNNNSNSIEKSGGSENSLSDKNILPSIPNMYNNRNKNRTIINSMENPNTLKDYIFNTDGLNNNKNNEKDKNKIKNMNKNADKQFYNVVLISSPKTVRYKKEESTINQQSPINTEFPLVNFTHINKNNSSINTDKQKEKKNNEKINKINKNETPKSNNIEKINKDKKEKNEIIQKNNKNEDLKPIINNIKKINNEINKDK